MANINELLARAAALRDETQLNSISPERAGGIMYDTLLAMNELWLQQGAALVISKIYASVAAMEADTAPVSDLTGLPLRPGQIVVIASSDSDNGSVYRYNGTSSPSWSLIGEIGNLEPVDSLDSDSTSLPLAAHQGKVLDGKISQLGQEMLNNVNIKEDVTPTATAALIKGNIGEEIILESRVNYRTIELQVSEGDVYFISTYRVAGDAYSVRLVDSNNIITNVLIPSTYEDYGVVENVPIIIPAGVAKMYVMSYWNTSPQILHVDKGTEVKEAVKFSQNVAMYGAISVNKSTGVVSALGQLDIYCNGIFKRFDDGDNLFTITRSGSRAISYDIETQTLIYDNSKKCVVGICFGYNVFFNSRSVEVEYSDGSSDRNTLYLSNNSLLGHSNVALYGALTIDSTTGVVTANGSFDIYYKTGKETQFKRFENEDLFTITKTAGSLQITFNTSTKLFEYGGDGIIVGVAYGKRLFLNSRAVEISYSDGKVDQNTLTLSNKDPEPSNALTALPADIYSQGYETWKRVTSWADDDDVFMLGFLTDVHTGGNDKYKHVGYFNELNRLYGLNVLINNGDIGLDVGETDEVANQVLSNTKSRMDATAPWLFVKGNHERLIADAKLGCIFNRAFKNQFNGIVFGEPYGSYGYYDIEWHKIRVYFINTSDAEVGTHYGISQTQLQWFAASLLTVPSDYNIVVITHLCIEDCGRTTEETTMRTGVFDTFCDIMESFNQRTAGSGSSISWDYTSVTYSKIVCNLSGDSHFNNNSKVGGVNYIVRQGGGGGRMNIIPEGATKDEITGNVAFYDVLCVKNDGNAKIFRIGVGGSNRDLAFTY